MGRLVVICGSMKKNGENMKKWAEHFRVLGYEAVKPHDVPYPRTHDPYEKSENRKFYFDRIDQAYLIIVVVDEDYVGFETACEIGYALKGNKRIVFSNYSAIDGVKALVADGTAEMWEGIPEVWEPI